MTDCPHDDVFAPAVTEKRILNLTTDKTGGIQWSGMRRGDTAHILVSNLSDVTARVDYPALGGLPDTSPYLSPGEHLHLEYPWIDRRPTAQPMADCETGVPGFSHREHGWRGPNAPDGHGPDEIEVRAPMGAGNDTLYAMGAVPNDPDTPDWVEGQGASAWRYVEEPAFEDGQLVCYTGRFRSTNGVGFMPVHTGGGSAEADRLVPPSGQGPWFHTDYSRLRLRPTRDSGDVYQATNLIGGAFDTQDWYEVRVVVDPRRDIDAAPTEGDYGAGQVYIRNLTEGEQGWTLLVRHTATGGPAESLTDVPLALRGDRPSGGAGDGSANPAGFDGWEVGFYGHGAMLDDLMALPVVLGDFDGNGAFNGLDIPGFKDTLAGASVPEPLTLSLVAAGMALALRRRR